MTIGERLREWRKSKGLTIVEITKATGISSGGLSDYENDKKAIGSKILISLYNEYGMDIQWILTGIKKEDTQILTENEKELLIYFNQLNEREQIKIIGMVEDRVSKKCQEETSSTSNAG